ncbi:MAG: flagellar hook capping FlgD N-terminal domain-containing protein, partial [Ignavibacteria bacterium]|nr:flagellar hook capping FlgD N-terminal domain-containing protein [Ignavibacteria bacterium]
TGNQNTTAVKGKSALGKDDFLKLMMAQMKYQDPMNPMDGTAFSAQLAQFSSLEQLTNINTSLAQSINANLMLAESVNNTMSATLIGKEVKLNNTTIQKNGQEAANIGYTLPGDAVSVKVSIYNEAGVLVKTYEDASTDKGDSKLSWDFTDNQGNTLPDGNYTFSVEAEGANGNLMEVTHFLYGQISGVKFTTEGTKLLVNNSEYLLSDILEIVNPE